MNKSSHLSTEGATGLDPLTTGASLVAQSIKHPPAVQETWVRSLGWEDPLEKDMATHHSSALAWRIPWTAGYSPWCHRELDTTEVTELACTVLNTTEIHTNTHINTMGYYSAIKKE